jgi:hypothetical protein
VREVEKIGGRDKRRKVPYPVGDPPVVEVVIVAVVAVATVATVGLGREVGRGVGRGAEVGRGVGRGAEVG